MKMIGIFTSLCIIVCLLIFAKSDFPDRQTQSQVDATDERASHELDRQREDALSERSAATSAANTETVFGVDVKKDRNCDVEQQYVANDAGDLVEVISCVPRTSEAQHPYENFSNDALASLSYSDSDAAMELGKRAIDADPDAAFQLMLRASALSGDSEPLTWLATQSYSLVSTNGQLDVESLKKNYELHSISKQLGARNHNVEFIRNMLEMAGLKESDLRELDRQVSRRIEGMKRIQTDVKGESTMGDASNASDA